MRWQQVEDYCDAAEVAEMTSAPVQTKLPSS